MNHFATNLKILRTERNLTQPALAKALNVSNGIISLWENGKFEPTATNIIKIATYFDVTTDELLRTELIK